MICPNCKAKSGVASTLDDSSVVYRDRKCKVCGFRFVTEEKTIKNTFWKRLAHSRRKSRRKE